MIVRPARSCGLDEAMAEAVEISSYKDFIKYLLEHKRKPEEIRTLTCEYYTYDERIKWETYIVCMDMYGYEQQAYLFTNAPLEVFKDFKKGKECIEEILKELV